MSIDFSPVGRLLASPARAAMLDALLDGRPLSAGELARVGGIGASTASEHLAELVRGGLVRVSSYGRHRYYALADAGVAQALEALGHICRATPVRSLRAATEAQALMYARTCYDHLAGTLGVALHDVLLGRGWLEATPDGYSLTGPGDAALTRVDVDVAGAAARRRTFARPCLDWTERRPHLAGALGAALTVTFLERGWLERAARRRGLGVTEAGRAGLGEAFGIHTEELAAARARPAEAAAAAGAG
jgi:DNA-binding transcriptional ArsR family regulator